MNTNIQIRTGNGPFPSVIINDIDPSLSLQYWVDWVKAKDVIPVQVIFLNGNNGRPAVGIRLKSEPDAQRLLL